MNFQFTGFKTTTMTTTKKTKPECKYKAPTKKRKKWKNKPKKAKRSSTVKNATRHV